MTTPEAAAALGIASATVRLQIHRGRFPGARRIGRDWHIPEAAVETYRLASLGRPGLASASYTGENPRGRKAAA